jgi:hypothetical protein
VKQSKRPNSPPRCYATDPAKVPLIGVDQGGGHGEHTDNQTPQASGQVSDD